MSTIRYVKGVGHIQKKWNLPPEYCGCSKCGNTYTPGKTMVCTKCDGCSRTVKILDVHDKQHTEKCCQCKKPKWITCEKAVSEIL